jgi:hypothetical protein
MGLSDEIDNYMKYQIMKVLAPSAVSVISENNERIRQSRYAHPVVIQIEKRRHYPVRAHGGKI